MTASGTVRTATEIRLIQLAATMPGWSSTPDDDAIWWVTSPMNSASKNRRWCVIGSADGSLDPEAMESGHGPQIDTWTISCGLADTTQVDDPLVAKAAAEAAVNQLADLLAANHRLSIPGMPAVGCRDVQVTRFDGPNFAWENGQASLTWIDFDITAVADIRRNQ